jgi:hypothetical protein
VQKLLYAVVIMKRKLLHYFEGHLVCVEHGLGEIIWNRRAMGRFAKWALEIMGHDITYVPQTVIKSKALVDFVAEWIGIQQPPAPVNREHWSMYFYGSFTLNGAREGVMLISPKGDQLLYMIWLHFHATNYVEYEALINGLRIKAELGV